MLRRIAYGLLTALTVTVSPAHGADIEVRGARVLTAGEVRALVAEATPGPAALDRVREAYFRRGYMRADVSAGRAPGDSTWVISIEEGPRATIGRAVVAGTLSRPRDQVAKRLGLEAGAPYRPSAIEQGIRSLLADYDREGYPFAQVWVDSVGYDPEADTVALKLYIVEGRAPVIEGVEVEGLTRTRPELAVRIAGIETGRPYRGAMLRDAYARLSSSGVFSEVRYPAVRMAPDGTGVKVALVVKEPQRSHTFVSALGYAEPEGDEDRQISGLVDLRLNNIGGTLRNLGVLWSNDGRDRVETRLDYRDLFFLGRRLAVGVRLHQIGLDTLYTWQSVGVEVEKPVGAAGITAGLHGDRNVFSVGDVRRTWRARGSLGIRLRSGRAVGGSFATQVRATVARKRKIPREGDEETLVQYIFEAETDAVVPLGHVLSLRNALTYRGLESDEDVVPLSERFYIGGARTLRGYKENQFNGRRVATARTELLLGGSRTENVYVFTDVGYVLRETLDPEGTVVRDEIVRAGYGFGVRTGSRFGNFDLSFGVGEKLSLQQTKVHVLIEQSF